MKMCVFAANNNTGSATPVPNLGSSYGVFGSSAVPGAMATGQVYTDDEDDNSNSVRGFPTNFDMSTFMNPPARNGGTRLFTVRVR